MRGDACAALYATSVHIEGTHMQIINEGCMLFDPFHK